MAYAVDMAGKTYRYLDFEDAQRALELYDEMEQKVRASLPNRVFECAQPMVFQATGYPYRVDSVGELWRFADVMQEGRLALTFEALGGLTEREFELLKAVTASVVWLTEKLGPRVVPGSALLRAFLAYRAIKADIPRGHVLDFGPGSGYVSALLLADGFTVTAMDTSQAFALWQSLFLPLVIAGGRLHQPGWWEWYERDDFAFDAVTANHMLNELHPNALAHFRARMLKLNGAKLYVENFGSEIMRRTWETRKALEGVPMRLVTPMVPINVKCKWSDLTQFWISEYGGVPCSADEKFLKSIGAT